MSSSFYHEKKIVIRPNLSEITRIKNHGSNNPAIMLIGIYSSELKTCVHAKACTWVFIATSVITARTRSLDKQRYIQTMAYYLALKRNELSSHEKTQRKLKCKLLGERR